MTNYKIKTYYTIIIKWKQTKDGHKLGENAAVSVTIWKIYVENQLQ